MKKEGKEVFKRFDGDKFKVKERDVVNSMIEDTIVDAVKEHWKYAVENKLNLRDVCYIKACKKFV